MGAMKHIDHERGIHTEQSPIECIQQEYPGSFLMCPECGAGEERIKIGCRSSRWGEGCHGQHRIVTLLHCGECEAKLDVIDNIDELKRWFYRILRSYVCEFELRGQNHTTRLPEGKGVGDIADGFWLDDDGSYTQGSDAVYWIPPGKIVGVEAKTVEWPLSE